MGQTESTPDSVNLDSIARNAVVQTAVQHMIDAAVENATREMVEREKSRIRELEARVEREIEILETTIANLRQQRSTAEMKLGKVERLGACVEKLEKRVGALEFSVNTTVETILPEAKAFVESLLQKPKSTAEAPTQTTSADCPSLPSDLSEGANVSVLNSPPLASIRSSDTTPASTSSASKTPRSSAGPDPAFPATSAARQPVPSTSAASSPPSTFFSGAAVDGSASFPNFCSYPPPPVPSGTLPSSTSVVFPAGTAPRGKKTLQFAPRKNNPVTMLHRAVLQGKEEEVRRLLKGKVNINARGRDGLTAAHLAAMQGNPAMLDLLLRQGALVDLRDRRGWQALHWAASRDCDGRCVAMLAEAGAELDGRSPPAGDTPLHVAASNGNEGAATELLRAGAKSALQNSRGQTPLDLAQSNMKLRQLLE